MTLGQEKVPRRTSMLVPRNRKNSFGDLSSLFGCTVWDLRRRKIMMSRHAATEMENLKEQIYNAEDFLLSKGIELPEIPSSEMPDILEDDESLRTFAICPEFIDISETLDKWFDDETIRIIMEYSFRVYTITEDEIMMRINIYKFSIQSSVHIGDLVTRLNHLRALIDWFVNFEAEVLPRCHRKYKEYISRHWIYNYCANKVLGDNYPFVGYKAYENLLQNQIKCSITVDLDRFAAACLPWEKKKK